MATKPDTMRLTYRGPASQSIYEMGEFGYSPVLVPDAVYELPTEFAKRLLASNVHFQVARPASTFKFKQEAESSVLATSSEQENK